MSDKGEKLRRRWTQTQNIIYSTKGSDFLGKE